MEQWLLDRHRSEQTKGETPEAGEGTITHYTSVDNLGLIDLSSGRTVVFDHLVDERDPDVGLEVYAREFTWNGRLGWVATEVESLESHRAPEPEPASPGRTPPPPDYPEVGKVEANIEELLEMAPQLESLPEEAIFLRPTPGEGDTRTRFQGAPLVPATFEWPEGPNGPMRFIGQLDFGELAEVDGEDVGGLPEAGILALFCDSEMWCNDEDDAYWQLAWAPDPDEARELVPPSDAVDRPAVGVDLEVYPTLPGGFDQTYLPGPEAYDAPATSAAVDDFLWEFADAYSPSPRHHVGGHGDWIQWDCRKAAARQVESEPSEWVLLWAVDSDPHTHGELFWGDLGRLYLMIREEDMERRKFGRVQAFVQFY